MSQFKVIALALGKSADLDEAAVLAAVNELKSQVTTAQANETEWKNKFIELQKTQAVALADQAVEFGLVAEPLKDAVVEDLLKDFPAKSVTLTASIEAKKKELEKNGKQSTVAGAVALANRTTGGAQPDAKESFDYLQKHNPVELGRIRTEEPEKYAQLCKDYKAGVRFTT